MFDNNTIDVTITYGTPVTFSLKMISISQENELRQKSFGQTEAERAEKEYSNNVAILADLSEKMPTGLFPNKPEGVKTGDINIDYAENFKTAKDMVEKFFETKSAIKERIAFYAVRAFFVRLSPSDFF